MKREPVHRVGAPGRLSLATAFRLIGQAFAEAFRSLASSSKLESRWSRLRYCGESF